MIYLDNSATTRFKPSCMFDAMVAELTNSSNSGRGGHNDSIDLAIKIFDARATIKNFFSAPVDYPLVFTQNCTEALNLAIFGYLRNFSKQKINVILTANEHNSVLRPLYYLSQNQPITLTVIKPQQDGSISPQAILSAVQPETKLICVCHVSNVTGATSQISDIGKIALTKDIPMLVDCAQSAGHLPINVIESNIAFLACAGHKGLHGPQGTGFLIYNPKYSVSPIRFGGTGTNSASLVQPTAPPEGLESGTLNSAGILGLAESVKWTSTNFHKLNLNSHYLTTELLYGLKQMSQYKVYTAYNNGVIAFNHTAHTSTDIGEILNSNNIAVRCGLHCAPLIHQHLGTLECGAIRASIGFNNSINDINYLLQILKDI